MHGSCKREGVHYSEAKIYVACEMTRQLSEQDQSIGITTLSVHILHLTLQINISPWRSKRVWLTILEYFQGL